MGGFQVWGDFSNNHSANYLEVYHEQETRIAETGVANTSGKHRTSTNQLQIGCHFGDPHVHEKAFTLEIHHGFSLKF